MTFKGNLALKVPQIPTNHCTREDDSCCQGRWVSGAIQHGIKVDRLVRDLLVQFWWGYWKCGPLIAPASSPKRIILSRTDAKETESRTRYLEPQTIGHTGPDMGTHRQVSDSSGRLLLGSEMKLKICRGDLRLSFCGYHLDQASWAGSVFPCDPVVEGFN